MLDHRKEQTRAHMLAKTSIERVTITLTYQLFSRIRKRGRRNCKLSVEKRRREAEIRKRPVVVVKYLVSPPHRHDVQLSFMCMSGPGSGSPDLVLCPFRILSFFRLSLFPGKSARRELEQA